MAKDEKKKIDVKKAKEELRDWLVKYTFCDVQNGWPCGTCVVYLLEQLGLKLSSDEYYEHNKPVDRINEVWRAILQIRVSNQKELMEKVKGSQKGQH